MAHLANAAARELEQGGIDAEVIDLRTIKPLDKACILDSVRKTGRLVIADGGWRSFGVAAEVAALVSEEAFHCLRAPIVRVTLPDCPAPASRTLEAVYYPTEKDIVAAVQKVIN